MHPTPRSPRPWGTGARADSRPRRRAVPRDLQLPHVQRVEELAERAAPGPVGGQPRVLRDDELRQARAGHPPARTLHFGLHHARHVVEHRLCIRRARCRCLRRQGGSTVGLPGRVPDSEVIYTK